MASEIHHTFGFGFNIQAQKFQQRRVPCPTLSTMKGGAGGSVPQPAKGGTDDTHEKGKGKFLALKGKLQAKGKDIFALKGKFHATGKGGKDPSMAKSGGSEPNSSKGKGQPVKAKPSEQKDSGLV
jgi:hypothetical protein